MAKISFLLFTVALIAFLHAYEARQVANVGQAFEKDLHYKAEAKKMSSQGLTCTLSKSKAMWNELGNAYRKDMDLRPYEKKLKHFSRATTQKSAPAKMKKPVSIIQSILKDFGLNGGRK